MNTLKIMSYILALVGFSSLLLTRELPTFTIIITFVSLSLLVFKEFRFIETPANEKFWNSILIVSLVYSIIALFLLDTEHIIVAVNFLVIVQIVKLFNLRKGKDHLHVFVTSFLQFLASSSLTGELIYIFPLLFYIAVLPAAFILLNLGEEYSMYKGYNMINAVASTVADRHFWIGNGGIWLITILHIMLFFIIVPRLGIGLFYRKNLNLIHISGFSEKVDIGKFGEIMENTQVVMRVLFDRSKIKVPHVSYFRGVAFDHYENSVWTRSTREMTRLNRGAKGMIALRRDIAPENLEKIEIVLEPLDTPVIFTVYTPAYIEGNFYYLFRDDFDALYSKSAFYTKSRYFVYFNHSSYLSRYNDISDEALKPYLGLPRLSTDITNLAKQVTSGIHSIRDKAIKVESFLKKTYQYTLTVKKPLGITPLEDFLLYSKKGYCEHFATAMVVMLRSIDIPARLVAGYTARQWNDVGKFFVVRESDAHTWVEAYLPSIGWIPFDPTPITHEPRITQSLYTTISEYIELLRLRWDRYVIDYSYKDQVSVVKFFIQMGLNTKRIFHITMKRWLDILQKPKSWQLKKPSLMNEAVALFSVIGVVSLLFLLHRFQKKRSFSKRRYGSIWFYAEMLKVLESIGFTKKDTMTAKEFSSMVIRKMGDGLL
ncbi:MAG: DUF3488 and transglutaminase-like domain-containing protein, partial [Thermodesulfobacteriota bacterium]|nr:DUF3488 and transglutaminase-like domain-containing protein [Thermodesulfobacteriota bacterium]